MQWKLFAKMHYISPVLSTDIYFILHIINSEIVAICSVFYEALQIWISERISYTRTTHSISYSTRLLTTNFSTFHLKKGFVQPNFAVGSPPGSLGCPKSLSAVPPPPEIWHMHPCFHRPWVPLFAFFFSHGLLSRFYLYLVRMVLLVHWYSSLCSIFKWAFAEILSLPFWPIFYLYLVIIKL